MFLINHQIWVTFRHIGGWRVQGGGPKKPGTARASTKSRFVVQNKNPKQSLRSELKEEAQTALGNGNRKLFTCCSRDTGMQRRRLTQDSRLDGPTQNTNRHSLLVCPEHQVTAIRQSGTGERHQGPETAIRRREEPQSLKWETTLENTTETEHNVTLTTFCCSLLQFSENLRHIRVNWFCDRRTVNRL